ncbi:hypothetical protein ACQKEG_21020, partial [Klebsiella quasipneumoniae]
MFSNRLASHLERGVVGFPTTLASSVGLIMASPVILTVTSGFGMGGDTFALAVLLAFIMMQAQVTTFAEAATLIPTTGSVYDYISCGMGRFFAITGALCAYLIVHIYTMGEYVVPQLINKYSLSPEFHNVTFSFTQ